MTKRDIRDTLIAAYALAGIVFLAGLAVFLALTLSLWFFVLLPAAMALVVPWTGIVSRRVDDGRWFPK